MRQGAGMIELAYSSSVPGCRHDRAGPLYYQVQYTNTKIQIQIQIHCAEAKDNVQHRLVYSMAKSHSGTVGVGEKRGRGGRREREKERRERERAASERDDYYTFSPALIVSRVGFFHALCRRDIRDD